MMNRGSTLFLKVTVWLMGLAALAICAVALPAGISSDEVGYYRPLLAGLYVPAVPFFIVLFQTLQLLGYIDKDTAFSNDSIQALKKIKYCAAVIGSLFAAGLPYIYRVADKDDAPGVMLLGLVLVFAPIVIAMFAAVLQKLLQNAITIKSENDLTV